MPAHGHAIRSGGVEFRQRLRERGAVDADADDGLRERGSLEAAPAGLRDALATTLARLCCLTSVHSDLGLALDADGRVRVLGQRPLDGLEPADGLQWIGEAVETARQLRDLVALQAGEPPLPSQGNHDAPR